MPLLVSTLNAELFDVQMSPGVCLSGQKGLWGKMNVDYGHVRRVNAGVFSFLKEKVDFGIYMYVYRADFLYL